MKFTALAVNFHYQISHYHTFEMMDGESPAQFKERVKEKMTGFCEGHEPDEIFVFPCGMLAHHYDVVHGW